MHSVITMKNTNTILAAEIAAHIVAPRALTVGSLAVFTTYNGKQIGCSVVRMWAAGEISNTAQIEVKVIGEQGCYRNGMKITVEAAVVSAAV